MVWTAGKEQRGRENLGREEIGAQGAPVIHMYTRVGVLDAPSNFFVGTWAIIFTYKLIGLGLGAKVGIDQDWLCLSFSY